MRTLFLTRTDVVISGALDGLAARHRAFANNLANVETPGFQPSDVPFEAQLRQIRDQLREEPLSLGRTPHLALDSAPDSQDADRLDANGVQADQQVVRLAENTLTYEALVQATRMREELLRSVVTEGRR